MSDINPTALMMEEVNDDNTKFQVEDWMNDQDIRIIPVVDEVFNKVMSGEYQEENIVPAGIEMLQERLSSEEDFLEARNLFLDCVESV
jgi:Mg/Co/Ni transporter MgtE